MKNLDMEVVKHMLQQASANLGHKKAKGFGTMHTKRSGITMQAQRLPSGGVKVCLHSNR